MDTRGCRNLQGLNRAQRECLHGHLQVHKWLMSEEAGHDVGMPVAKTDFMDKHFDRVSREFRTAHCGEVCEHRADCPLKAEIDKIPSVEHRLRLRNGSN